MSLISSLELYTTVVFQICCNLSRRDFRQGVWGCLSRPQRVKGGCVIINTFIEMLPSVAIARSENLGVAFLLLTYLAYFFFKRTKNSRHFISFLTKCEIGYFFQQILSPDYFF